MAVSYIQHKDMVFYQNGHATWAGGLSDTPQVLSLNLKCKKFQCHISLSLDISPVP